MNIKDYHQSPAKFQADLFLPTGSGTKRFGDCMKFFQRMRFHAINPSLLAVSLGKKPPVTRIWDERTKGASKDTDWACCLLFLLGLSRRSLRIQVGAYDQSQASEVLQIIRGILRIDQPVNRFLDEVLTVTTDRITNKRTDAFCEVLTSDKFGSHGARPSCVLITELTHQKDEGFAATLCDNADKMPHGLLIIQTNSGHTGTWQERWKQTFQESDRWRVMEYSRPAPWISEEALAESAKRNSTGRFNRLFRGIWASDVSGALGSDDIDACTKTTLGPMYGDEPGWIWYAGLDIGLVKHSTGFCVIGKHVGHYEEKEIEKKLPPRAEAMIDLGLQERPEPTYEVSETEATHRLRLADCESWKPVPGKTRVSLEAVKRRIIRAHETFNLQGVAIDPHQGEHLIELLEREGIPAVRCLQTPSSLQDQATATIECFQQRTLDIYSDASDLLADVKRLQVKDTGLKIRLVSPEKTASDGPGTGHGDLASALSFAIALAKSEKLGFLSPAVSGRMLIVD